MLAANEPGKVKATLAEMLRQNWERLSPLFISEFLETETPLGSFSAAAGFKDQQLNFAQFSEDPDSISLILDARRSRSEMRADPLIPDFEAIETGTPFQFSLQNTLNENETVDFNLEWDDADGAFTLTSKVNGKKTGYVTFSVDDQIYIHGFFPYNGLKPNDKARNIKLPQLIVSWLAYVAHEGKKSVGSTATNSAALLNIYRRYFSDELFTSMKTQPVLRKDGFDGLYDVARTGGVYLSAESSQLTSFRLLPNSIYEVEKSGKENLRKGDQVRIDESGNIWPAASHNRNSKPLARVYSFGFPLNTRGTPKIEALPELIPVRSETRAQGLFRREKAVQDLILKIQRDFEQIKKDGAFVFDIEKTIADFMSPLPPEAVQFLVKLLQSDRRVVIITGIPEEPAIDYALAPLIEKLKSQPDRFKFLTLYSNGGATKATFSSIGKIISDEAYNNRHAVNGSFLPLMQQVLADMAKKNFGLGVNAGTTVEEWRKWVQGRFPKLRLDASWVEGNSNWTPQVIDAHEFWKRSREGGEPVTLPAIVPAGRTSAGHGIINILHLPQYPHDVRPAVEENILKAIVALDPHHQIRTYSGGISAIDIIGVETNKALALKDSIQTLKLNPNRVYYFGDQFYVKKDAAGLTIAEGNDESVAADPALTGVTTLGVSETDPVNSKLTLHIGRGVEATTQFFAAIFQGARSETRSTRAEDDRSGFGSPGKTEVFLRSEMREDFDRITAAEVKRIFVSNEYDLNGPKLGYDAVRFGLLIPALLRHFPNADIEHQGVHFSGLFDHLNGHDRLKVVEHSTGNYDLAISQSPDETTPRNVSAEHKMDIASLVVNGDLKVSLQKKGEEPHHFKFAGTSFWMQTKQFLEELGLFNEQDDYYDSGVGGHQIDWLRLAQVLDSEEVLYFENDRSESQTKLVVGRDRQDLRKRLTVEKILTGERDFIFVNLDAVTNEISGFKRVFWEKFLSTVARDNPGKHILFSGGASKKSFESARKMVDLISPALQIDQSAFVLPAQISLAQVLDFMAISRAVITPDTGFMHLADMVKRPLLALGSYERMTSHWKGQQADTLTIYQADNSALENPQAVAALFQKLLSQTQNRGRKVMPLPGFVHFSSWLAKMIDFMNLSAEKNFSDEVVQAWTQYFNELIQNQGLIKERHLQFKEAVIPNQKERDSAEYRRMANQLMMLDAYMGLHLVGTDLEQKKAKIIEFGKDFITYMLSQLVGTTSVEAADFLKSLKPVKLSKPEESNIVKELIPARSELRATEIKFEKVPVSPIQFDAAQTNLNRAELRHLGSRVITTILTAGITFFSGTRAAAIAEIKKFAGLFQDNENVLNALNLKSQDKNIWMDVYDELPVDQISVFAEVLEANPNRVLRIVVLNASAQAQTRRLFRESLSQFGKRFEIISKSAMTQIISSSAESVLVTAPENLSLKLSQSFSQAPVNAAFVSYEFVQGGVASVRIMASGAMGDVNSLLAKQALEPEVVPSGKLSFRKFSMNYLKALAEKLTQFFMARKAVASAA